MLLPKWDEWSCWGSSLQGSTWVLPSRSTRNCWYPLGHGYHFPEAIFALGETIYPNPEEMATVQRRLIDVKGLGRGELETITICQTRGWFYAAIDQRAIAYARSLGVTTFALRVILRLLWTQHILGQEEVGALIQQLWEKDKLMIVNPEEIFRE